MSVLEDRKGRYTSIDFLKGIACIAVVLIHIQFPGRIGFAVRQICRFAVPLFFAVSGFFFTNASGMAATAKKLRHAILLFLGALFFHLALCSFGIDGMSSRAYIRGFLDTQNLLSFFISNPPYHWPHLWFLGALVYIYLFALVWFGDGKRFRTAGPLGAILLVCMMAVQEFAAWLPFDPALPIAGMRIRLCVLFLFRGLPFFLLGIWLRSREGSVRTWRIPAIAYPILVAVGAVMAVLEAKWTVKAQFYIGNYLMVAGMFFWALRFPDRGYKAIAFVGQNLSLYVYVIHIAVWKSLLAIVRHAGVDSAIARWCMPFLVVLVSVSLAFAYHFAKKFCTCRLSCCPS